MSINIVPEIVHFAGHGSRPPVSPPPYRSPPRGLSGIECRPVQRVQRPGVCVVPCVVCSAACDVQPFRVRWMRRGATGGVYSRRPAPTGQSRHHRKNKKGSKNTLPPIVNLKNPAKKQKDPYKGSVLCAILALQALKGRNLQWLKVK